MERIDSDNKKLKILKKKKKEEQGDINIFKHFM